MNEKSTIKPVVGITIGDYNGIGPEVILKSLEGNQLSKLCTPIIYGSIKVLNQYRNLLGIKDWTLNGIQKAEQASIKLTNVITCWNDHQIEIAPGSITEEAGQASYACLKSAVVDLKNNKIDALVTGPINKDNIQNLNFKFPGHTEYLAEEFGVKDALMFMVSGDLRVGVLTGHIPLDKVSSHITTENLTAKIDQIIQSLKGDFGIKKPKVAVLGLNPHAGENGLLGSEEIEVITPTLKKFLEKGDLVFGPYSADGFFAAKSYKKFDAVLAMYHDQGLIPFKTIAFNEGVNFTAGLPVVRTSPDHGTAYNIAGKNEAEPGSLLQAIYLACDVVRFREENELLNKNSLKSKPQQSESQHPSKSGSKQRFNNN